MPSIIQRITASRRRRSAFGSALFLLGMLSLFVFGVWPTFPVPGTFASQRLMFSLVPGQNGPLLIGMNEFDHPAWPQNIGVVEADAHIGEPAVRVGDRPWVMKDGLDIVIHQHPQATWPWTNMSRQEVIEMLRPQVMSELKMHTNAPWVLDDWWRRSNRTIRWGQVAISVASWLVCPLLAIGIWLWVMPSRVEREYKRLRRCVCPKCGYTLAGVETRCPECGRVIPGDEQAVVLAASAQAGSS